MVGPPLLQLWLPILRCPHRPLAHHPLAVESVLGGCSFSKIGVLSYRLQRISGWLRGKIFEP